MTPQELKRKQTRISQLRQEMGNAEVEKREIGNQRKQLKDQVNSFNNQITTLDRKISAARQEIEQIERSLQKNTRKSIIVSEHAMLRYIERVIGIDLKEIESKILPGRTADTVSTLGDGQFPVDEHIIRVRNGVIVTVLGKDGDKH